MKAFANRMVEDHSRLSDELKQLAAKKGLTPPTQMDKDHREDLDDIKKLSGPKLDKKYAEEMVDDHEDDVKEFTEASQKLKDPDVRAWAAKALPLLQSHLDQAKQLRAKIAPES